MAMARRRTDAERHPDALREARCQWFWRYRRECDVPVRVWVDRHPFPGLDSYTVQHTIEQACCRSEWCATFIDEIDPRDKGLWGFDGGA